MKKILSIISALAISLSMLTFTTSCSEQEEVGEYDNWAERNQHYVDSIAHLAQNGTDGWSKILSFTLSDSIESLSPDNNHYIYVKKLEKGNGTYMPQFCDSIRAHYRGRLIPSVSYPQGNVFDKSYSSDTPNEATDVPTLFCPNSVVKGFSTALMHMVEGDKWQVVIPYYIGYGTSMSEGGIPGYSALIFDIKIAKIYKYKIDTNTSWH